jgi:hypothetical protein
VRLNVSARSDLGSAVAFVVVALLAFGCGELPARSPGAGAGTMTITSPASGTVVHTATVEVAGTAPAGARVVHDISFAPDDDVIAGVDGTWSMTVTLEEGANELVFRVGDDRSTEVRLGLQYTPGLTASAEPTTPPTEASDGPPSAPPTDPSPTLAPTPASVTFGDGTLEVGGDVEPGTYRLREPAGLCYWARLKGFGGTLDEIIANDNVIDAYSVVTIGRSDAGFESRGCGEWSANLSAVTTDTGAIEVDGTYIVGTDVSAGTWRSTGGELCYWARLKGFGGTLDEIIANDNVLGGSTVVTIGSADKGFVTRGCGTWTRS